MATVPNDAVSVNDYYKQNVYNSSDNTIGEVSDVLLESGRVKAGHIKCRRFSRPWWEVCERTLQCPAGDREKWQTLLGHGYDKGSPDKRAWVSIRLHNR